MNCKVLFDRQWNSVLSCLKNLSRILTSLKENLPLYYYDYLGVISRVKFSEDYLTVGFRLFRTRTAVGGNAAGSGGNGRSRLLLARIIESESFSAMLGLPYNIGSSNSASLRLPWSSRPAYKRSVAF